MQLLWEVGPWCRRVLSLPLPSTGNLRRERFDTMVGQLWSTFSVSGGKGGGWGRGCKWYTSVVTLPSCYFNRIMPWGGGTMNRIFTQEPIRLLSHSALGDPSKTRRGPLGSVPAYEWKSFEELRHEDYTKKKHNTPPCVATDVSVLLHFCS